MLISLILLTFFVGLGLSSNYVLAEEVVDEIAINVPVSCSVSGIGMNSHNTTLAPGAYDSHVGETTAKVFCNDREGFAVYAIGYTDEVDGKNVMTSTISPDYDIVTGTATTGNSQWAMKLALVTSPTPTYPVSIQNGFDSFHTVLDDYTLVIKRESATDVGISAEGASFTSTYQIYASLTQPADTYVGKVKYVLVHPNDTAEIPVKDDRVGVLFDGNGLTFPSGADKNRVVYGNSCSSMYVGTTPEILETSNLTNGVYDGTPYSDGEIVYDVVTLDGADKVKVVIDYGLTGDTGNITIAEGEWGGWDDDDPEGYYYEINSWGGPDDEPLDITGTKTFYFDGDTVSLEMDSWGEPIDNYDYGMYARFYPLYDTEQSGTEETLVCSLSSTPLSGAYVEPNTWNGKWYSIINDELVWFEDESEIFEHILNNSDTLFGSTIKLYAKNPYKIFYDGNSATNGSMNGVYNEIDYLDEKTGLRAPNFAKTGYGFAGWSENPNAVVNGSDKIYGPNEIIVGRELSYDGNRETTLYAVWVPSSGNMQDYSCNVLPSGRVVALTDTRDNNVYTVSKMQDGNCWMMENLRLDAANSSDAGKAQGFGGIFTGLADSEDGDFRTNRSNSKYSVASVGASYRLPRYNNNNINIGGTNSNGVPLVAIPECSDDYVPDCTANMTDHAEWYSYGNYYTWAAAMANTEAFSVEGASNSVNTSICPKGWSLPYGGKSGTGLTNGSFSYLDVQMGGDGFAGEDFVYDEEISNHWFSYPNNMVMAGYWSDMSGERGSFGTYWSRTNVSDIFAWRFMVTSYSLGYSNFHKTVASPMRCIIINN